MTPGLRGMGGLHDVLLSAWSVETSSKWSRENPARGQCSVTALVVHDLFGGDILKTETAEGTHFYNLVDGRKWDFTISQFDHPIPFDDTPSSRAEALADTSVAQYEALKRRFFRQRPSARLVVVDPRDRILLFRYVYRDGPLAGQAFWATPGGALEPGESFPEAARRELAEETGFDMPVGPQVHVRLNRFRLRDGVPVEAEERFFVVRVPDDTLRADNPDPLERAMIDDMRWWDVAELAASPETVYPRELATLLQGTSGWLADGPADAQ